MKIAVIGCSHGSLDDIYNSIIRCDSESEKVGGDKIDLMICCGDFQVSLSSLLRSFYHSSLCIL